ncbi:hypothetical protein, partial [Pseudomonas sp. PM2]|uniref:hypothetical protein n=1 Tax=Pseudomonas sp. PM2 TaxID=215172 RepID=UPI003FA1C777
CSASPAPAVCCGSEHYAGSLSRRPERLGREPVARETLSAATMMSAMPTRIPALIFLPRERRDRHRIAIDRRLNMIFNLS